MQHYRLRRKQELMLFQMLLRYSQPMLKPRPMRLLLRKLQLTLLLPLLPQMPLLPQLPKLLRMPLLPKLSLMLRL